MGVTKIKTNLFSFSIAKIRLVKILDIRAIPPKYLIPQEPKPDKKGILEAIKNGEDVPGVEIERSEGLRIR